MAVKCRPLGDYVTHVDLVDENGTALFVNLPKVQAEYVMNHHNKKGYKPRLYMVPTNGPKL